MIESNEFIIQLSSEGGKVIVGGGDGESSGQGSGYVVWNPHMFAEGLAHLSDTVGTAFNVGIWVFLGVTGLYALISIVRSLFG